MGGGASIGVGGRQERSAVFRYTTLFRSVRGQHEVAEIGAGAADGELEMILAGVDVGDGDRAGCGQVAGDDAGVLGHISNGRGADHRGIVGAVDGETDVLGGAVQIGRASCRERGGGAAVGVGGGQELQGDVGDVV